LKAGREVKHLSSTQKDVFLMVHASVYAQQKQSFGWDQWTLQLDNQFHSTRIQSSSKVGPN